MMKDTDNPIAWRWRDNEHQAWNFIDFDPVNMDYVFVEPLFARPAAKEIEKLRNAMSVAIDMLLERSFGSPARSPAHNARVCLQFALTGDEPDDD